MMTAIQLNNQENKLNIKTFLKYFKKKRRYIEEQITTNHNKLLMGKGAIEKNKQYYRRKNAKFYIKNSKNRKQFLRPQISIPTNIHK